MLRADPGEASLLETCPAPATRREVTGDKEFLVPRELLLPATSPLTDLPGPSCLLADILVREATSSFIYAPVHLPWCGPVASCFAQ